MLTVVRRELDHLASLRFPIGWVFTQDEETASGAPANPDQRAEPDRQPVREPSAKTGSRGWSWPARQPDQSVLSAVVGILFSTIAISLGSSFRFDTLNRCMSLRAAGKREDTSDSPEKKEAGKT